MYKIIRIDVMCHLNKSTGFIVIIENASKLPKNGTCFMAWCIYVLRTEWNNGYMGSMHCNPVQPAIPMATADPDLQKSLDEWSWQIMRIFVSKYMELHPSVPQRLRITVYINCRVEIWYRIIRLECDNNGTVTSRRRGVGDGLSVTGCRWRTVGC